MLGGLFAINQLSSNLSQRTEPNDISCESLNELELGLAVVMKFAVDEVNANQSLLPGIKLGYEIQDTCRQTAVIVRPAISFLTAKNSKELSVQCNYTDYETSVVAVIGPLDSEMVSAIGKVLGFFLMPQISFGASSNKFSDKRIYPSFFRTVPSDTLQIDAMVLLLEEFKWNWVAVVASDEEFGQQGAQEFTKKAESTSMCVAYQGMIPVYTDPVETVQNIVDNIQATKVKVVLVFSLPDPAEVFFKEIINRKIKGVWIASGSWVFDNRLTSIPAMLTIGTVIGFTYKTKKLDLLPAYTEVLFTKLSEQKKSSYDAPHVQNPCPQCRNLSPANVSLVVDPAVRRVSFSVYAAIYSVAQSLHNMLGCNSSTCKWDAETRILPWKLLRVLQNTSFNINGKHLVFDSSGNPNIGYIVIQWVWTDSNLGFLVVGSFEEELRINKSRFKWHTENVPESTCSAACGIGQVRRVKGFHSCCFDCVDCLPGTYQAKNECSINMSRRRIGRRALSDTSDVDVDGTELEVAKLLRQYRIMDADRQAYKIQAQQQMRKQQQEIEKLTAEQKEMEHKLSAYNSLSRQKKDKTNAERIKVLQEQRERLDEELEKETQHQRELQKEISSMEIKLKGLRKGNSSTSDIQRSAHRRNEEALCTLENKLQGGLTKFNEQLTKNSRLREDLQTLQIERVRFMRLHDRLLQECKDMRRKISEEIHLSNAAHDARVEAQSKLAMIREKAEKELFQYNTEMRELERVISHECSLKDFITAKYSQKMDQERTESGLKEQRTKESTDESPDDLNVFFQKIQSVTGEEDPEMMVSRFIQGEDRNFALFNFVNEQNNEAELLREQISQIQEEMKHFQEKALRQEEDYRCSLRDVDERRKQAELQTEDFENRAVILSKTLEEVKKGVSSLVSGVECEMEDAINDNNIMQYLSAVEQKTNQLLNIQTFLDNKEIGKECNSADLPKFLFGQDSEMLQENVDMQPAIHSGEFDVDNLLVTDEEERPLSQGELRKRILEGVMQRESLGSKLATKSFRASTRILEETPMVV
ncbi:taste receptor type 1 member 3 isoform X2 [Stigmatopora nigra]